MSIIREPLDVDFVVDPRPLTKEEQAAISAFIKADKVKKAKLLQKQRSAKRHTSKRKKQTA